MNRDRPAGWLDIALLVCLLIPVALLVLFLVGSLVFTGGQVLQEGDTIWADVWSFPVFPVPSWLLIVPAAVSALLVVPFVATTPVAQAPRIAARFGQALAAGLASVFFAFAFPAADGFVAMPDAGDGYLGLHLAAAVITVVVVLVLAVGLFVKGGAHDRARREGHVS